jgi:FMN-dependent NADH-azoreductase
VDGSASRPEGGAPPLGHRPAAGPHLGERHRRRFHPRIGAHPDQREALANAKDPVEELRSADVIVLAVPFYNFGVSQHFKTWVDLVIAGAGPTTPVLKGKPTVLATVRGGSYGPGTPREGWDHSTPYLRRIPEDLWQAHLTVIERELTLAATTPGMEGLRDLAAALRTKATEEADKTGTGIATA